MKLLNQSKDVSVSSTLFIKEFETILNVFENVLDNSLNVVGLNLRNNAVVAVVKDAVHGLLVSVLRYCSTGVKGLSSPLSFFGFFYRLIFKNHFTF